MCRSRRELSNEYLLAKSASIQPRTSPSKFGGNIQYYSLVSLLSFRVRSGSRHAAGTCQLAAHERNTTKEVFSTSVIFLFHSIFVIQPLSPCKKCDIKYNLHFIISFYGEKNCTQIRPYLESLHLNSRRDLPNFANILRATLANVPWSRSILKKISRRTARKTFLILSIHM